MRERRGKGRPKLPTGQVKKLTVSIAVTVEEHRAIRKAALAEDLSVSAWLRRWLLDRLRRHGK